MENQEFDIELLEKKLEEYEQADSNVRSEEVLEFVKKVRRQLYARVEELLRRQGCRKVFAIVTSANELSLAFHRAIGYRDAAHFRQVGFKFGRWYDVTWLEKSLCPPGKPSEFPISWKEVL